MKTAGTFKTEFIWGKMNILAYSTMLYCTQVCILVYLSLFVPINTLDSHVDITRATLDSHVDITRATLDSHVDITRTTFETLIDNI